MLLFSGNYFHYFDIRLSNCTFVLLLQIKKNQEQIINLLTNLRK